jgi:pimeloyl-ACP methyl ester carboxylesterase
VLFLRFQLTQLWIFYESIIIGSATMKIVPAVILLFCLLIQPLFAGESITMQASDGHPLVGTLSRPKPGKDLQAGVVLLPMYRHTKESWQPLVDTLNRAGFTTLSLDLRGHGESRYDANGRDDSQRVIARDPVLFNVMYLDAAAAALRLEKETGVKPQRIALIGASVGCSVALQAVASGTVKTYAVVVMTPGSNYLGIPTMEQLKTWPGTPLLILSSEEEKGRGAKPIYDALQGKGAELRLFSETSIHGTTMFGEVPGVEELITGWLGMKLSKQK